MSECKKPSYTRISEHAARHQGGFVRRRELLAVGLTRTTIESWIETGRLIPAWQGVYAVGHMPTDPKALAFGAMLAAGDGSALAGESAGAFYGALWQWPQTPELVSPHQRRVTGLVVHRSRTLALRDVWRFDGLRVTSPARTALDLAPRLSPRRLKAVVDHLRLHGRRRDRLTLGQLVDVVVRNPRHPGAAPLRLLLGQASKRARRSDFEREVWPAFATAHDIPDYEQNEIVAGEEVDVLVDGLVAVELDTIETHLLNFETDRRRDAHILAETGIPVIRVLDTQIEEEPERVAADILATVARRRVETGRVRAESSSR